MKILAKTTKSCFTLKIFLWAGLFSHLWQPASHQTTDRKWNLDQNSKKRSMRGADAFDRKTEGVHKGADVAETRDKPLQFWWKLLFSKVFTWRWPEEGKGLELGGGNKERILRWSSSSKWSSALTFDQSGQKIEGNFLKEHMLWTHPITQPSKEAAPEKHAKHIHCLCKGFPIYIAGPTHR